MQSLELRVLRGQAAAGGDVDDERGAIAGQVAQGGLLTGKGAQREVLQRHKSSEGVDWDGKYRL